MTAAGPRASERARRVVVAVHDVAPRTAARVRGMLEALDALDARPRVLLVIPDESGDGPIGDSPELVQLLQDEVRAGSEVVMHGYTHRVAGPLRGPALTRLRGRLFAGTAAEFLSLDAWAAEARLRAGRDRLAALGLEPAGFCAPGWLSTPALPAQLRGAGFRYLAGMRAIEDLRSGRRLPLPWFGYMGAGAVQEWLVALGAGAQRRARSRAPVTVCFLHPPPDPHAAAYHRALRDLRTALRTRRPTTYAAVLDAVA